MGQIVTVLPRGRTPIPPVRPYSRPIVINDKALVAYYVFDVEGKLMDLSGSGIQATTGAISQTYTDGGGGADTITRASGSYTDNGFVVGHRIKIRDTDHHNGTHILTAVAADTLSVATGTFAGADETVSSTVSLELGNHGTISGATWTAKGRFGSALSFDGDNDYVTLNPEYSFDFGATTDFSFWMWFYPNAAADTRYLYVKNVDYLAAWVANTDRVIAKIDDTVTAKNINTTGTVNEGEWNFFCATHDRDGNLSGYLNADAANTVDISSVGDINNNTDMRISQAATAFDGQMDIFGCIKRVLTPIEVKNLRESGL